ncbi:MAG: integrating conjugative element protein [Gammaproteobacteria bacterium]
MKKILETLWLVLIVSTGMVSTAHSADDEFFYALGGGAPLSLGSTNRNAIGISGGISWNADLMCGNFDINATIRSQINGALEDVWTMVENEISGVIASWPALLLQRLDPVLYDQLQNGVLQASETFNLAKVNCEDIVNKISKSSENDGWASMAQSEYWVGESNTADPEIVETEKNAETDGRNNGVTWIGGAKAGGAGQPPIKLHEETSMAGYNLLLRRNADDTSNVTPAACTGAPVCETWASPAQAAEWVTDVIGDKEIRTCDNCDKLKARIGMGIHRKVEDEKVLIQAGLVDLVNGTTPMIPAALDNVRGGSGFPVTRQLIEAIREEDNPAGIVDRLSAELAVSRTMDRALMARRILLAGMKDSDVANNDNAIKPLLEAVNELNDEIQNAVFEIDVRTKITSNTAVQLLRRARMREAVPVIEQPAPQTIRDGATP